LEPVLVGPVDDFRISLDVIGDDVDPEEVSSLLGCQPTTGHRKGDEILGADGSFRRHARSGRWSIAVTSRHLGEPDFDTVLSNLIESLTDDLSIWTKLSQQFDTRLFCGIFLTDSNRGFNISAELMAALSARDLYIGLDIYGAELPQTFD
jgi:hypothetical protein